MYVALVAMSMTPLWAILRTTFQLALLLRICLKTGFVLSAE